MATMKIIVTGAAGLVGQNLIPRLKASGAHRILGIDKHAANLRILRALHPDIEVIDADLAERGAWEQSFVGADAVVLGQAQIGGLVESEFTRNNIVATQRILDALKGGFSGHIVHISSSVVNSAAVDLYTESKKAGEKLMLEAGLPCVVLRPTLMFGWFDRKHVGWLARFMAKAPVFPIPGDGRYLRQPLYAGDFCDIIAACIEKRLSGTYNISGQERIDYIDLIRAVREAIHVRTPIVKIPYGVFAALLYTYALFDKDPPFTVKQLEALVTPDVFEVIDWPAIFGVKATPLREALEQTFNDPRYSRVVLEF
jgi:nucleoside-diphosphate-sugar epimerase